MAPCSRCGTPAVTRIRYSGQDLCKEHFLAFFDARAKAEVARQGRIPAGTVVVGLSGGKDSAALLHFLHRLVARRRDVRLVAVTVDEGIAGYRDDALPVCRALTHRLGIEWHVVRTRDLAGYDIDSYAAGTAGPSGKAARQLGVSGPLPGDAEGRALLPPSPRPACGPCGVYRRAGLNRIARDLGAVALATGHNLDDTAQTVLMNVLQGDPQRLARLAPHGDAKPGLVPRITPLRAIPEKEVLLYALLHGVPYHDAECPYAVRAHRFALRDTVLALEAKTPGTRHALLRFQDKVQPALAAGLAGAPPGACPSCGEPTSGDVCRACVWRA